MWQIYSHVLYHSLNSSDIYYFLSLVSWKFNGMLVHNGHFQPGMCSELRFGRCIVSQSCANYGPQSSPLIYDSALLQPSLSI